MSANPARSSSLREWRAPGRPSCRWAPRCPRPASAWLAAVRASSFSVGSFRISRAAPCPRWTMPQCPCAMYSHRQTSVMTSRVGQLLLQQPHGLLHDAVAGIGAARPWRPSCPGCRTAAPPARPAAWAAAASRTSSSGESWNTPGMASMGRRSLRPDRANSGSTKLLGVQTRFSNQPAQGRRLPQPARPVHGKSG